MNLQQTPQEQHHWTAARWESLRAAYFQRMGKPDNSTRCKLIAAHHENMAREARKGAKS